jgi:hypothetical protein
MERPSVAGCASFAGWLEEEGGRKEGRNVHRWTNHSAGDRWDCSSCLLFSMEPGTGLSPVRQQRCSKEEEEEEEEEEKKFFGTFLSQEKKEENKNYKTASFFRMDGWLYGWMDGFGHPNVVVSIRLLSTIYPHLHCTLFRWEGNLAGEVDFFLLLLFFGKKK